MIRSIAQRLRKLERGAAEEEAGGLVLVTRSLVGCRILDADLAALKEADFLRGGSRHLRILGSDEIQGLTERERQFLAERRRTVR
jgi:hypothetical protein